MVAKLNSFELQGYKTFASRTEFIFADGITAIVGPNGSGKSNIADAIRWVLGEQSYSLLRAKRTEDMIFGGSEQRPRAGMASATIVFDNSDGWLPIDFSEVSITRRAYRDGDNEYLLNGQRVRLKDVSELLAQSGLAERTYTVIGQGLVDAALALKAEERRRLFEEAAGVGLYRTRREDATRRLESTRRNLERVEDILAELQPRLRSLERQARRAQEYEQVKEDLRVILREWYGYHWHQAQNELRSAQETARQQEENLGNVHNQRSSLDNDLEEQRTHIQESRLQLAEAYREATDLGKRREILSRDRAVADERLRLLSKQLDATRGEIDRLYGEERILQERMESSNSEIAELQSDADAAIHQVKILRQQLQSKQEERLSVEKDAQFAREHLAKLLATQAQLHFQQTELEKGMEKLYQSLEIAKRETERLEREYADGRVSYQKNEQMKMAGEIESQLAEQVLSEIQQRLSECDAKHKTVIAKLEQKRSELARLEVQLGVLEDAEKSLFGYTKGARILLLAMTNAKLGSPLGALGSLLEIPAHLELAIASALGEYVDAMVLERMDDVDEAIKLLSNEDARGVVLPLDTLIPGKTLALDLAKAPGSADTILGVAANLVKVRKGLRDVVELLLGQVLIVRDCQAAKEILKSRDWRNLPGFRLVTLTGELYYANGPVVIGGMGQSVISRPRQMRDVRGQLEMWQNEETKLGNEASEIKKQIADLRAKEGEQAALVAEHHRVLREVEVIRIRQELDLEKVRQTLLWQQGQCANLEAEIAVQQDALKLVMEDSRRLVAEIDDAIKKEKEKNEHLDQINLDEERKQLTYWELQAAVVERALSEAQKRLAERELQRDQFVLESREMKAREVGLEAELTGLHEQLSKLQLDEQAVIEALRQAELITRPIEAALAESESRQHELITKDADSRQVLNIAEHHYAQAKILLARRQEALESLRRRIEDDFGLVAFEYADSISGPKPLPITEMVEELPRVTKVTPELEELVQRQRAQLRRMGPVNLDAKVEYQQVKERYDFLIEQVRDLRSAEVNIQEVITELDVLMEREFRKTFDSVAQEFRSIFTRLFGGGSARLVLTDPEDLTETGIDIEARLPGRREQGLSLLSGGERSLAAAALIFSLLRVAPTPFCILDEVDAMLDEANVGRYREMLTELSETTQFIVVTHNRNTVQVAGAIYGVTMGRDSASQVIGLRLDELGEKYGV